MIKLYELMIKRDFWKVDEAKRVELKPSEVGEGVPVTVHIDDEDYLVFKIPTTGTMIFLHPSQIKQLKKFLSKVK